MNQKLQLSLTRGGQLASTIEEQLNNSVMKSYEVLNQSQAKLVDLEKETREMETERQMVQTTIVRNRDNARRLIQLIERDEAIERDLSVTINANLAAIHSLRESQVQTPVPVQEQSNEDGQATETK